MKPLIITFTGLLFLTSCNSQQSDAKKTADKIQEQVKQNTPGSMATSTTGYYMKATVDGKEWIADDIMPPAASARISGGKNNEYISLPYNKQYLKVGYKIALGEDEAVDISFKGVGLATTKKGEMEITKVDDKWAEGKFYCTLLINDTGKLLEITNGFFRIPVQ